MFQITGTHVLIVALGLGMFGFIKYQESKINTLKTDLQTVSNIAEAQGKDIAQLRLDYSRLQVMDKERKDSKAEVDKADVKLKKDSNRKDVVAKKPKLVEAQINKSFDKFAQDLQELTR